jgi:hypothetical protein
MPDGESYEYLKQDPGHTEETRSWEYAKYPRVIATLPLPAGTVDVYTIAERWNSSHILVSWLDDGRQPHRAWIPAGNARRVSDSEWDVEEYRRCPENLRHIRWGNRLPGFLPE